MTEQLRSNAFNTFRRLAFCNAALQDIYSARDVLRTVQQAMPEARERVEARLTEFMAKSSDRSEYIKALVGGDPLDTARRHFEEEVPHVLASAFLILVHAEVEKALRRIADFVRQRLDLRIGMNELRGGPFDQAVLFFQKLAQIPLADLNGWEELREFQELRDAVVHRRAQLGTRDKERNKLHRLANKYSGLLILPSGDWSDENAVLAFDEKLVEEMLNAAERFFKGLVDRVFPDTDAESEEAER
jgi:hypothetical protein